MAPTGTDDPDPLAPSARRLATRWRHRHGAGEKQGGEVVQLARLAGALGALGVVAEAVQEAAEDAALAGQGLAGSGRLGAFVAFGLVVVGAGDRVHDLRLAERLRTRDLRDEADQVAVE